MVQSPYSVGLISRGWKLGAGEAGEGNSSRQSVTKGGSSPKANRPVSLLHTIQTEMRKRLSILRVSEQKLYPIRKKMILLKHIQLRTLHFFSNPLELLLSRSSQKKKKEFFVHLTLCSGPSWTSKRQISLPFCTPKACSPLAGASLQAIVGRTPGNTVYLTILVVFIAEFRSSSIDTLLV